MGRVGRPPSIDSPPCPRCERTEEVASQGIREVEGTPQRAFRCGACEHVFVPGAARQGPSPELKRAIASVRSQTDAPYRLIADAVSNHLGIEVSHTTVQAWCRDPPEEDEGSEACEQLSILWALRHEIEDEARRSDA